MTNWTFTNGWGASTVDAFSGSRSISESPAGTYAASRTSAATYNLPLDLSDATAAYLSFWVKHRAENGDDKLQIQLSPSGPGAGSSFSPACGRNTISENSTAPALTGIRENWTRETIDLNDYLGSSNIGLRFLFTSNSSNNDDGFYIDDIEVVKSDAIVLAPGALVPVRPSAAGAEKILPKVFPNPATSRLLVSFNKNNNTQYTIKLSTVAGITVRQQTFSVSGKSNRELDLTSLINQLYILTIVDHETGQQTVYKIIKQ